VEVHSSSTAPGVRESLVRNRNIHFTTDKLNAGEALSRAHFLSMGAYAGQAATILRDKGILRIVEESGDNCVSATEIAEQADLSINSATALLEAGLGIGLLSLSEGRFYLTKAGYYFEHDKTVRTNTDFMRDVCLPGIERLGSSLEQDAPLGLKLFGEWNRIFDALPQLPEQVRDSWYAFNNYHSEAAFSEALPKVFEHKPKRILDIGGSTGRFALACLDYSDEVHIGIADLVIDPQQAEPGIASAVRAGRVSLHSVDVLDISYSLLDGYDTIWMSQFLPCFSEEQINEILAKCYALLPPDGRIWLMETFWDRQRYEAAASSLQLTSLYFVNIATGISRMYRSTDLLEMIRKAGFDVISQADSIGQRHTLLELRKT
jgi:hypothetical protein